MSSLDKTNQLSVCTSMLSYMIQNAVDLTCMTSTWHQRWKDNVEKKLMFIYRQNDSGTENEETTVWLL